MYRYVYELEICGFFLPVVEVSGFFRHTPVGVWVLLSKTLKLFVFTVQVDIVINIILCSPLGERE